MPELPEVETTLCGIKPYVLGQIIQKLVIRHHQLRWPIPLTLQKELQNKRIQSLERRAKYILFRFNTGTLIWHIGMSVSLRIVILDCLLEIHEQVDLHFDNP